MPLHRTQTPTSEMRAHSCYSVRGTTDAARQQPGRHSTPVSQSADTTHSSCSAAQSQYPQVSALGLLRALNPASLLQHCRPMLLHECVQSSNLTDPYLPINVVL